MRDKIKEVAEQYGVSPDVAAEIGEVAENAIQESVYLSIGIDNCRVSQLRNGDLRATFELQDLGGSANGLIAGKLVAASDLPLVMTLMYEDD